MVAELDIPPMVNWSDRLPALDLSTLSWRFIEGRKNSVPTWTLQLSLQPMVQLRMTPLSTATGALPTVTVAVTVLVAVLITDTVPELALVT